jgi:hypothetical protein
MEMLKFAMNFTISNAEDIKPLQKYIIVLTKEEKDAVGSIISQFLRLYIRSIDGETLTSIQLAAGRLPPRLIEALIRFRRILFTFIYYGEEQQNDTRSFAWSCSAFGTACLHRDYY